MITRLPKPGKRASQQHFATETDLVAELAKRFSARWAVRALKWEVRSHGRSRTDLACLVRDIGAPHEVPLLIGIEAKLTDWPRAIGQASLNRYAFDLAFIAVPATLGAKSLLPTAARHGVGVLGVMPGALDLLLPAQRREPDPYLRARIAAQLVAVRARGRSSVEELVAPSDESGWGVA